jgi:signal transduction histidine kinase
MGIEDASRVIGLRPGEYIRCIHSCEMPGGCGTSPYCSTCGAVIAIMSALHSEQPQENCCAVTVEKDNRDVELFFQVRCCPIKVGDNSFILFFLHDISVQKQRDMLDSTFYHDINNLLTGLLGKTELFQLKHTWDAERFSGLQKLIQRMSQELSMQQALNSSMSHVYQPLYCEVMVDSILDDLEETFDGHPLCEGVKLDIAKIGEPALLVTDPNLVNRILVNMVTNALEATGQGEAVRVFTEPGGNTITFSVWNKKHIPSEHAQKIFTRNFTTKEQLGHGLGTYSMKLFGEKVLGGMVSFTTSESEGTTFNLTLLQQ